MFNPLVARICWIAGCLIGISEGQTLTYFKFAQTALRINSTGCPCWWDLGGHIIDETTGLPFSCACCLEGTVQCGYPMHNYCQSKRLQFRGCPGIQDNKWTLSELGHPCLWNRSDRKCAWCSYDGLQCSNQAVVKQQGNGARIPGQFCLKYNKNGEKCIGESQDCRFRADLCGDNASCVVIPAKKYASNEFARCACNPGFIGNGFDCYSSTTGQLQPNAKNQNFEAVLVSYALFVPTDGDTSSLDLGNTLNTVSDMRALLDQGQGCLKCNLNPGARPTCQI